MCCREAVRGEAAAAQDGLSFWVGGTGEWIVSSGWGRSWAVEFGWIMRWVGMSFRGGTGGHGKGGVVRWVTSSVG